MGRQSHRDQVFFLLLSLHNSAYLWQTHCLVSLLLGSAQSSKYIQGRVPWEVRLREVLLSPSQTNSRYWAALKQPPSEQCADSGGEWIQLKLVGLHQCGTGCRTACSHEDLLLRDSNCARFSCGEKGRGRYLTHVNALQVAYVLYIGFRMMNAFFCVCWQDFILDT